MRRHETDNLFQTMASRGDLQAQGRARPAEALPSSVRSTHVMVSCPGTMAPRSKEMKLCLVEPDHCRRNKRSTVIAVGVERAKLGRVEIFGCIAIARDGPWPSPTICAATYSNSL